MAYDISELLANKVHVLINPKSGGEPGRVAREVKERLGSDDVIYYTSQRKGDIKRFATEIAKQANQKKSSHLMFVIGGDGTINEAINADASLENIIYGVSSGTMGELAAFLGTRSPPRLCNLTNGFIDGECDINDYATKMDLLRVRYDITRNAEGRIADYKEIKAANIFSTGFESDVSQKVNASFKRGGLQKIFDFAVAGASVLKDYQPISLSYGINGSSELNLQSGKLLTFAVVNGRYAAGGLNIDPYARLDDGLATALMIKAMPIMQIAGGIIELKLPQSIPSSEFPENGDEADALYKSRKRYNLEYLPAIRSIALKHNKVESAREYYFEVDGEHHRIEKPESEMIIDVLPGATNILMIKD
jgi:diacylglycerol kinase family enzyme